jgi:hypothetical protein
METEASGEVLAVLTERFYPGWTGIVDGRKVPVLRLKGDTAEITLV